MVEWLASRRCLSSFLATWKYLNTIKGIRVGNIQISHLLFADDLVIASETSSGLQKLITGLQELSEQWHMEVKLWKTRISICNTICLIGNQMRKLMILMRNRRGKRIRLWGITLSVNNPRFIRFKINCWWINEKAFEAIYAARNLVHKSIGHQIPGPVLFKTTDSHIQPILDYGTENLYK